MASTCDHDWHKTNETATEVTHKCSKCKETYTRVKGNLLFAVLALLLVAACLGFTIWAGAPAA